METLALIVLVVAILVTFSVLVGCAFSGQPLVVPRHAAAQRSINEGGFSRLRAHRVGSVSAAQEGQRGQHPEVDPTAVVAGFLGQAEFVEDCGEMLFHIADLAVEVSGDTEVGVPFGDQSQDAFLIRGEPSSGQRSRPRGQRRLLEIPSDDLQGMILAGTRRSAGITSRGRGNGFDGDVVTASMSRFRCPLGRR